MLIGNKPLIYYQLEYLEKYGFTDILIITKESHFSKLKDVVDKYVGNLNPDDINYYIIEEDKLEGDEVETLPLMKQLVQNNKIRKDFIYFSGDLFLDETLNDIIDSHILKRSSLTVVFQEFPLEAPKKDGKGPIIEERDDYNIMCVDKTENRLLKLSKFQQDITIDKMFRVSKHSVAKFPHSVILANCIQNGMIVVKKEVANLLVNKLPNFSFEDCTDFEDEFLPYLVENQFNPQLIDALDIYVSEDEVLIDTLSSVKHDLKDKFSVHAYIVNKSFSKKVKTLNDLFQANMACLVKPVALPQCFVPTSNNLEALEIGEKPKGALPTPAAQTEEKAPKKEKKPKKGAEETKEETAKPEAVAPAKTQEVGQQNPMKDVTINNSRIGKTSHFGEKVKVERSIIGLGCTIKKGAKVVNSVLMKGVVVEEDAIVEGSILFDKVSVGTKAKVKTCFVKGHIQLQEKESYEKDTMTE